MKTITPADLQSLLTTDVDIIDVREPEEWATGHVPGARLVPLSLLRADPAGALPRDHVVFVCASGGRSARAAELADALGKQHVHSLDGGTDGWRAAGLPIIVPGQATASPRPRAPEVPLDAIVGANLAAERNARGLSLDALARESGVARTLLGQIEIGRAMPSIGVVWKLAQALGVPFATLLAQPTPRVGTTTTKRSSAHHLASADGRLTSRALYPIGEPGAAEFYELYLAPHSREDAGAHRPGTRENLVVAQGQLELRVGSETLHLETGDAINFSADLPHSYINTAAEACLMYLVMNYSGSTTR